MGLRGVGQMRWQITLALTTGFSGSQQCQARPGTHPGLAGLSFVAGLWKKCVLKNDSREWVKWLLYNAGHGEMEIQTGRTDREQPGEVLKSV